MTRHHWFAIDVDGEPFRVKGDPEMPPETRQALIALARAVRAMIARGELPQQTQEEAPDEREREH